MQDSHDEEDELEEIGESISGLKISALDLAIKASALSGNPKDPEEVLRVAKDYYKFIIEDYEPTKS